MRNIGTKRQFFFNHALLDLDKTTANVQVSDKPVRREKLMTFDELWENQKVSYPSFFYDEDVKKYRLYYCASMRKDLTKLNEDLKALAAELNIPGDKLAVSELFDIHMEGCDYHEEHRYFDIILSAEALENFVGLLHLRQDGEFELIADAKVTHDGDHLEFTVESFSPFAIVVDTTKNSPTGDNGMIFVCLALMLVSGVAVVLLNRKPRTV